jgi:TfoX/Sxy family transcriptional regulator of competence genes
MPAAKKTKLKPAPADLVTLFNHLLKSVPEAQTRKMFGYPSAFMSGNMFAGLFQDKMVFRLSEQDRASFLKQKTAKQFEPMRGRPLREYVVLSQAILASVKELESWMIRAAQFAKTLPPKKKK